MVCRTVLLLISNYKFGHIGLAQYISKNTTQYNSSRLIFPTHSNIHRHTVVKTKGTTKNTTFISRMAQKRKNYLSKLKETAIIYSKLFVPEINMNISGKLSSVWHLQKMQ